MSSPIPFGLIIPSRPVLVEPQVLSQTQYAFTFPAIPRFSHIVVFLLPGFSMPDGALAGVHLQLPETAPNFVLLGVIGTDKPSAIFKIREQTTASNAPGQTHGQKTNLEQAGGTVMLGISIEPSAALSGQLQAIKSGPAATSGQVTGSALSTKVLAQRIIKNAFNFLASCAGTVGPGGQEVVPLKNFQDWWTKFERRVENDPGFLERDET